MPNNAAAKKRVRQLTKRTLRNRVRKERLKKSLKSFKLVVEAGDKQAMAEALKVASKAVDKAATKGIIHKNAANRKKSNMAKAVATA